MERGEADYGVELTGEKPVRELGRSKKEAERERHMRTNIQNPEERATDGTRSKHGYGKGTVYKEATKAGSKEPKEGGGGQKPGFFRRGTMGKRVELGKGGQKVGKRSGFFHFETAFSGLFPHKSTQVVDFPYICVVRVFGEEHEMVTMGGSDCAWRVYFPGCSPKVVDVKMFGSRSRKGYWYVLCVLDRAEIWD